MIDETARTHAGLIERFYRGFQQRDYREMITCYHPDVVFSDPVFTDLRGWRAAAMWRMLCERGTDLTLTFEGITADERRGWAHWEATYTFGATGRKVVNAIDAEFEFANGLMLRHRDAFNLWRWAGMALGAKGVLLGWSPPVQNVIRHRAAQRLEQFIRQHGLSPDNIRQ
jgi:hypothetical protein